MLTKLTKKELLAVCEKYRLEDMKNGYVVPSYFKSWNKIQLQQYIDYMKSDKSTRRRTLAITGTIHREKY